LFDWFFQVPAVALAAHPNAEDAQAAVNEFKIEPKSQEESKAMFCLYEAWASATLAIRDDLFAFVASPLNQTALGPAMIARMSHTLESIDQPANLVAHRQCPNTWFVFYMALKVRSLQTCASPFAQHLRLPNFSPHARAGVQQHGGDAEIDEELREDVAVRRQCTRAVPRMPEIQLRRGQL
jgi:hypothetical protein